MDALTRLWLRAKVQAQFKLSYLNRSPVLQFYFLPLYLHKESYEWGHNDIQIYGHIEGVGKIISSHQDEEKEDW